MTTENVENPLEKIDIEKAGLALLDLHMALAADPSQRVNNRVDLHMIEINGEPIILISPEIMPAELHWAVDHSNYDVPSSFRELQSYFTKYGIQEGVIDAQVLAENLFEKMVGRGRLDKDGNLIIERFFTKSEALPEDIRFLSEHEAQRLLFEMTKRRLEFLKNERPQKPILSGVLFEQGRMLISEIRERDNVTFAGRSDIEVVFQGEIFGSVKRQKEKVRAILTGEKGQPNVINGLVTTFSLMKSKPKQRFDERTRQMENEITFSISNSLMLGIEGELHSAIRGNLKQIGAPFQRRIEALGGEIDPFDENTYDLQDFQVSNLAKYLKNETTRSFYNHVPQDISGAITIDILNKRFAVDLMYLQPTNLNPVQRSDYEETYIYTQIMALRKLARLVDLDEDFFNNFDIEFRINEPGNLGQMHDLTKGGRKLYELLTTDINLSLS